MVSKAEGLLYVPVWCDDGEIKPLADDDGKFPVTLADIDSTIDVNIKSSDIDVPVSVDAQTHTLDVNIESSDIDVPVSVDAQTQDLTVLGKSYCDAQWQNNPFPFGISDQYVEAESNASASSGTNTLTFSIVPSGEIWVIQSFVALATNNNPSQIQLYPVLMSTSICVGIETTGDKRDGVRIPNNLTLFPGDYLRAIYYGCTAGDGLYAFASGYKMTVETP